MIKLSQIFDFLMPRLFFGGGGGGPTSSTVTQTNLPDYLRPYVMGMMGQATQQLFRTSPARDPETGEVMKDPETGETIYNVGGPKPYTPYSQSAYTNYRDPETGQPVNLPSGWETVAGPTSAQQRASDIANWMGSEQGQQLLNEQYGRAQDFATQAGYGGQYAAGEALGYGQRGAGFGQTAADLAKQQGGYYGGYGHSVGALAGALAPAAQAYGEAGAQYGRAGQEAATKYGGEIGGLGIGYGAGAAGLAPRAAGLGGMYEQMATGPGEYQKYMSPYMQNVVAKQQEDAVNQAKIMEQGRKAAAARAGAFGGSRRIIEQAEADKALGSQLGNIQAQGLQKAFDQAQQNINQRAQLESQGLGQAGQLYGVGIQGAQTGLQGLDRQLAGAELGIKGAGMGLQGLGQANQLYGTALQGAGMGLQGLQQQLAGQQLGMQGAQTGLQGVQAGLGGYGLMGQMGGQLADITGARLGQLRDVSEFQYGMGERQRQLQQQRINQMIQNYAMAQERPMTNLQMMNALLRGYAVPGTTTTQYQAPAPLGGQLAGLGTAAAGISGLLGRGAKAGGLMDAGDGVDTLALNKALAGD